MATTTRSKERTECLADILITAVEDGCLNTWRVVSCYVHTPAEDARVLIHEIEDEDTETVHAVGLDTIAKGLGKVERGEDGCKLNSEILGAVMLAQRDNDPSGFDAYSADAVMQAGIFGEVIYG